MSPDTLAAGPQRMVPLKTASNGIFDDIVWVEPLDLPTAGNLLDRRVMGLPAAFIALCYVLSGGLPRDLLRIARAIFTVKSDGSKLELVDVTESVIADELSALRHRAMAQATSLEIPATPDLLELLSADIVPSDHTENSGLPPRPIDIKVIMDDLSRLWAGNARQRFANSNEGVAAVTAEICDSFLAGLFFLQTVHQLFTAKPDPVTNLDPVTKLAGCVTDGTFKFNDDAMLGGLARARTTLGVNPYLAAKMIQDVRKALSRRTDHPVPFADFEPEFLSANRSRQATTQPTGT